MSTRYPGGLITKSPVVPTGPSPASQGSASGIWTLEQQAQYKKAGTWPGQFSIGDAYAGGYYAGQISTTGNGVATHYLVVAPLSSGQSVKQWKTSNSSTSGTSSVIDGPTNSANMNNATHPAAQFCEGLTIGGYTDWYMPAKNELEVCYYNLKPAAQGNDTASGVNTNAVPSRSTPYTSGTPGQTSAVDFQSGGSQAFITDDYIASTEFDASNAWRQWFFTGLQRSTSKTTSRYVRAVRRVAV